MSTVNIATVVAGVAAVIALVGPAQSVFRRTVLRRADISARLHRLGPGAQLDFFVSIIGEPPAIRNTIALEMPDYSSTQDGDGEASTITRRFVRSTFVDPMFYLVAISDEDGSVRGFSITTRRKQFAPTFYAPPAPALARRLAAALPGRRSKARWLIRFRLGRSTFAAAAPGFEARPQVQAWLSARKWSYSEAWYLGNRGFYLTYVFSATSASPVGGYPKELHQADWADQEAATDVDDLGRYVFKPWAGSVRHTIRTTTVSVISWPLSVEYWPGGSSGPDLDEVRVLP